jgi:hypothetical protein
MKAEVSSETTVRTYQTTRSYISKYRNPAAVRNSKNNKNKQTPWFQSASELDRQTERPPLVGEVSANFSG